MIRFERPDTRNLPGLLRTVGRPKVAFHHNIT
jgi:hypothetical protein